ncbi:hypothetical protein BA062_35685 [Prauserella flavalba]|uniref:Uncharacterized protein n=1 Tax=Prauserella flavalba TaxID=1477506 RepID=A0A318LD46_9PSEU|nr:hypothetical protein BA062_35685 [Prauserella flavalba]
MAGQDPVRIRIVALFSWLTHRLVLVLAEDRGENQVRAARGPDGAGTAQGTMGDEAAASVAHEGSDVVAFGVHGSSWTELAAKLSGG